MKSLLIASLLTLMMIGHSIAQKDPKALQILDAMSAKYKKIPAFNAEFKYTMENPEEGIDEGFQGTILIKDDKYKLIMDEQEVLFDGTDVWTFLKEDNEVTVATYEAEDEDISLSNIFNIYKSGFKYLYLESRENGKIDVVDLVPEDLEKSYYKIRMLITSSDRALQSFKIFDKSGNRYVYTIVSFKPDNTLKDQDFTFNEKNYKGVEVIDFR